MHAASLPLIADHAPGYVKDAEIIRDELETVVSGSVARSVGS
jgi:hypothetical protein